MKKQKNRWSKDILDNFNSEHFPQELKDLVEEFFYPIYIEYISKRIQTKIIKGCQMKEFSLFSEIVGRDIIDINIDKSFSHYIESLKTLLIFTYWFDVFFRKIEFDEFVLNYREKEIMEKSTLNFFNSDYCFINIFRLSLLNKKIFKAFFEIYRYHLDNVKDMLSLIYYESKSKENSKLDDNIKDLYEYFLIFSSRFIFYFCGRYLVSPSLTNVVNDVFSPSPNPTFLSNIYDYTIKMGVLINSSFCHNTFVFRKIHNITLTNEEIRLLFNHEEKGEEFNTENYSLIRSLYSVNISY